MVAETFQHGEVWKIWNHKTINRWLGSAWNVWLKEIHRARTIEYFKTKPETGEAILAFKIFTGKRKMKEKLMYTYNVYTIFVVLEKAFDIVATVQTKQKVYWN